MEVRTSLMTHQIDIPSVRISFVEMFCADMNEICTLPGDIDYLICILIYASHFLHERRYRKR